MGCNYRNITSCSDAAPTFVGTIQFFSFTKAREFRTTGWQEPCPGRATHRGPLARVFSVAAARKGVWLRFDPPRDHDQQPAAPCEQHPSWCGPRHSSSAARPRRQRATTPTTWHSPALYREGPGRPQHSELSPAFPPRRRHHRSRQQGKHLSSRRRRGPEVSLLVV